MGTGIYVDKPVSQGDMAYLKTPTLLDMENVIIFSKGSETPLFIFKEFLNGLSTMYETISNAQVVGLPSIDSEFNVTLKNNSDQIRIVIKYSGWTNDCSFEFEDNIDQSYLPKIILDLKKIIAKFS
jgi:hypothetical protein